MSITHAKAEDRIAFCYAYLYIIYLFWYFFGLVFVDIITWLDFVGTGYESDYQANDRRL